MCLGAIYWTRLDKIYYANGKNDMAAIGFDDAFIYRELALDAAVRRLPAEHLPSETAAAAFDAW